MSFQNKNLYDLLGNDVEEDVGPVAPVREVVKKNTSSKKSDTAPPSADPARAKKNKSPSTGNEAALKNKNNNKEVSGPQSTATKHQKKPFDRHSRTGKTDSKKKLKQGWGEDDKRELEGEVEGTEDAAHDLEAEAEETESVDSTPKKSFQEYLAEQQQRQQELDGAKKIRQANEGAEQKWKSEEKIEKQEEIFFASTTSKKTKAKQAKEKKFLEIDASFADEQVPSFNKAPRGGFRGGRGNARGGATKRGGFRGGKSQAKPEVNDKNFPSL